MPDVTVAALAQLKRLDPDALKGFGLQDADFGVRFAYLDLDGRPARSRWRTGIRGAGGSAWSPEADLPIVPYIRPGHRDSVAEAGYLIVVEGESDCWTGWCYSIPVLGIPGSDQCGCLTLGHIEDAKVVYLQREPVAGSNATFPQGIEGYLQALVDRIRAVGFTGEIRIFDPPSGTEDISGLHFADPGGFVGTLRTALERAKSPSPSKIGNATPTAEGSADA